MCTVILKVNIRDLPETAWCFFSLQYATKADAGSVLICIVVDMVIRATTYIC